MATIVRDRSNLRIADLKQRQPARSRLLNVKVPGHILAAIDRMAKELDTSKTEVVIALMEAGLAQLGETRKK